MRNRRGAADKRAAEIGAASIADPTGAATERALRSILPRRPRRRASGWVELDQELERSVRGLPRRDR